MTFLINNGKRGQENSRSALQGTSVFYSHYLKTISNEYLRTCLRIFNLHLLKTFILVPLG